MLAYGPMFMQYITTFYVPFHTGLEIINSTSLLQQWVSESKKRVGWGIGSRRQYKVGVNRPTCLRFSRRLFKVGVKTRKYGK